MLAALPGGPQAGHVLGAFRYDLAPDSLLAALPETPLFVVTSFIPHPSNFAPVCHGDDYSDDFADGKEHSEPAVRGFIACCVL